MKYSTKPSPKPPRKKSGVCNKNNPGVMRARLTDEQLKIVEQRTLNLLEQKFQQGLKFILNGLGFKERKTQRKHKGSQNTRNQTA